MQCACAVLYCPLWPVRLYHIFPHHVIKVTIFGKKSLHIKCVLIFSRDFVWNISHSNKNWAGYYDKCTLHPSPVRPWQTGFGLSNSLFTGLPSHLRPFGLQFSTISTVLLLFVHVTCRSQFDLNLLSFSSKFLCFFCGQKECIRLFFWKISSRLMAIVFFLFPRSNYHFCVEEWREPTHYVLLFSKIYGPKSV
jgi:hypothetical protein